MRYDESHEKKMKRVLSVKIHPREVDARPPASAAPRGYGDIIPWSQFMTTEVCKHFIWIVLPFHPRSLEAQLCPYVAPSLLAINDVWNEQYDLRNLLNLLNRVKGHLQEILIAFMSYVHVRWMILRKFSDRTRFLPDWKNFLLRRFS